MDGQVGEGNRQMKDGINQRINSKTYWLGMAVLVLGFLQSNISQLDAWLGEYRGPVNVAIGLAILVMRELTKAPLESKPTKIQNPLKKDAGAT